MKNSDNEREGVEAELPSAVPAAEMTSRVTLARCEQIFQQNQWQYRVTKQTIETIFDDIPFSFGFFAEDNLLLCHAVVSDLPQNAVRNDLLSFIEDWHRSHAIPKIYLHDQESGVGQIYAAHSIVFTDYRERPLGATDAQLALHIEDFIVAVLIFQNDLREFSVLE